MYKVRLCFSKTGAAAFTSHLDLMKVLQRSFRRAKLPVKYSSGFNPHIVLSILVPLSTGYQSICELCDFELLTQQTHEEIVEKLNDALPVDIRAIHAQTAVRPVAQAQNSRFEITMHGDAELCQQALQNPLVVEKRSKRSSKPVDVRDYIKEIAFEQKGSDLICRCVLSAGNDPLNPKYITEAFYAANALTSIDAEYMRTAILDEQLKDFFEHE